VNAIAPGAVETNQAKSRPPERRQELTAMAPLGTIGQPEE